MRRPSRTLARVAVALLAAAALPACSSAATDDTTPVPSATSPIDPGASPGVNDAGDAVGEPVESELNTEG